jgi:PIN domain nuclease of toxin-antitoxin system
MKLLLDTHVFVWCVTADPVLPQTFRLAIQDPANAVFLSVVSIWEAVIKAGIGKWPFPDPPADYLPRQCDAHGIIPLPLDDGAMSHLAGLPPLHRDPFDRVLIAQALQSGLMLASTDAVVRAYPVPLLPLA